MKANESNEKGKQDHVLKRVRKISMAMDKREFWIFTSILGLFLVMIGLLVYYFL